MTKKSDGPANFILEQFRLLRSSIDALGVKIESLDNKVAFEFKAVRQEISVIRRQTIGEVYKANKTFAGFADIEARLEAVERKVYS